MKKLLILPLTLLWVFLLSGCTTSFENPNPDICSAGATEGVYVCQVTYTSYFDTTVTLKLYVTKADTYQVDDIYSYTESILSTYHKYLDKYHSYEGITNVYSINQANDETSYLSQELFDVIQFGLENENIIQVDDVSLFNLALGPVLSIWHNARESESCDTTVSLAYNVCPVPSDLIDGISFPTDPQNISLNSEDLSFTFLEDGMSIDLGGYGKGYVSEILSDYYDSLNIKYLLNVGNSNIKTGGINPNNGDGYYYVALTKPEIGFSISPSYFVYLKISNDVAVVTSGNYQRYFVGDDGEVYHHIIDPRTNYPGGEAMSVTVFYEDGGLADIFSTAIFLMTVEEGQAFVNRTEGLEAIWYLQDGTIEYSLCFENYLYQWPE